MAEINLLTISNSETVSAAKNSSLALVASTLYKNGFIVSTNSCISLDANIIEASIKQIFETSDYLLICTESQIDSSYIIKKIIVKYFNEELITNIYAKNNIAVYNRNLNIPQSKEDLSYAYMPKTARAITNDLGVMQGFLMNNNGKTLIFMPLESAQLKSIFITSVLPYLIDKNEKRNRVSVFKTFGLTASELASILKDLRKNKQKVEIICNESFLDGEVIINYPEKTEQIVIDGFVAAIYKRLSQYIYSETDTTLPETLYNILSINNSTLAVSEDSTCGTFVSEFYKYNLKAQLALIEAYFVPTNESKIKILGVDSEILCKDKELLDGSDIAYQMAVGTLENSGSDYVAATYSKDNTIFIAIGNSDGIHVFTQSFNGSSEELITKFTNCTYFNLIKKIKKNDFHLPQTTI